LLVLCHVVLLNVLRLLLHTEIGQTCCRLLSLAHTLLRPLKRKTATEL